MTSITCFRETCGISGRPPKGEVSSPEILKRFSTAARVGVVYSEERPLAAGFLYGFRRTLEIPCASSDRRYNRLAPNMLLYNSVLKYACNSGYSVFDFGRSTPDGGTYRFKQQWGQNQRHFIGTIGCLTTNRYLI